MRKNDRHSGQLPLDKVEEAVEDAVINSNRPKGMPTLSQIKSEVLRQGLTAEDAEHMYDVWLVNGFRRKGGGKIQDWIAAVRVWKRSGFFPSQRTAAREPQRGFKPPSEAEVLAFAKEKRWTTGYGRWCYNFFVANNWKYYKDPIVSPDQWRALMCTELMERGPK